MFTTSTSTPTTARDPEEKSMRASLRVEGAAWAPAETMYEWRGQSNEPAAPADSGAELSAPELSSRTSPETPLSGETLRAIYLKLPEPDVARLITEIYRLRALVRRAALFADTAASRGSEKRLDITSRTLFNGLATALKAEPYIGDYRLPPMELQAGAASRYRAPSAYCSVALTEVSPDSVADADAPTSTKREKLFTWKLVPQPGRGDQMWRMSRYRGLVVARAGDPIQARELAAERFSTNVSAHRIENPGLENGASENRPIENPSMENPWRTRRLVRVELMDNSPFDRVEQPGVVYP
jgi:hypothetical protein